MGYEENELKVLIPFVALFLLVSFLVLYRIVANYNEKVVASSYVIEEVDKEIVNGEIRKHYYFYTTRKFCISDNDVNYVSPDYDLSDVEDLKTYLVFLDSSGKPVTGRYDVSDREWSYDDKLCLPFLVELPSNTASKIKYAKFLFYSGKKLIGSLLVPVHKS